jgi:hypothetical protein
MADPIRDHRSIDNYSGIGLNLHSRAIRQDAHWINSWDALLGVARVSVLIVAGITLIRAFVVVAARVDDFFQKRSKQRKIPAV